MFYWVIHKVRQTKCAQWYWNLGGIKVLIWCNTFVKHSLQEIFFLNEDGFSPWEPQYISNCHLFQWTPLCKYQSKTKKLHHSPSGIPLAMRLQSDFLEVKGRKTIKINKNYIDLKGNCLQFHHRRKFYLFSNRVAATFLFKHNFAVNWASISLLSWVCCDCRFACMYLTLSALFLIMSLSRQYFENHSADFVSETKKPLVLRTRSSNTGKLSLT